MKKLIILLLLVISFNSYAQQIKTDDENEIKSVIHQLFESLEKKDTLLFKKSFRLDSQVWHIKSYQAKPNMEMRLVERDVDLLMTLPKVREVALSFEIKIHNGLAMTWVPYELYVNDQFPHCGIDIFTLFKIGGIWKIINLAYSTEGSICDDLNNNT